MSDRKWRDINELWLERYLGDAGLMPLWSDDPEGADIYEDHPFGWQVSWVLSDVDWARLRRAWENRSRLASTATVSSERGEGKTQKLREAYQCIEQLTRQNQAMAAEIEVLRRRK